MKHIKLFEDFVKESIQPDFLQMQADMVGMTREEWIAHYGTPEIGSGIDEALNIYKDIYVRSHGKDPKGTGMWAFSYSKGGEDPFFTPSMPWVEAQKWAKEKAKNDGKNSIWVLG